MALAASGRWKGLLTLGAAGTLLLTACTAPEPAPSPSATSSPAPTSEPYAGPAVFIGDELDLLLLTEDEIRTLIPGATEVGPSTSVLEQISDGSGPAADPAACEVFYMEQSLGTVGSRTVSWKVPDDAEYGSGRLYVLQFADEAQAQTRMDQLLAGAEQCAEFRREGPATFDAVIAEPTEEVRAFAGTMTDVDGGYDWRAFEGFASVGNVVVEFSQPFSGDRSFDAEAAASLLRDRAEQAHEALIRELTENPPSSEEPPAGDASAPWGDWQITHAGVGPIRVGDSIDESLAAFEPGQVTGPAYDGGPWTATAPDGAGTILIQPTEDGGTVRSVTAGNDRSIMTAPQTGTGLPAAGTVRVGALVSEAMAALPGGTTVTVASSGDDWYDVASRDGRLIRFRADRDVVDPAAVIVGISWEDATVRGDLRFGD